ncbi:SEFIR domain-containing protein [Methanosarcina barkeri]|uniref:SEFIR domain-containing protein n=1 Tax=Methanosarcina barkeri TaxID=2208 RepID=UPI0006D1E359|nr:SEFIR domain-containing protein [Methanosarcina barkeri]
MSTLKEQEFPITDPSLNEIHYNNVPKSSRVFISYSHDSNKHKKSVLLLSNRLRREGIDCNIDQYETSPPEGWFCWMSNQIEEADFVLIVCTENYEKRFKGKDEVGKGMGAKWEGAIITQELYYSGANNKCIPIVFSPQDSEYIPSILKSATYYVLNMEEINDEIYDELYARLTYQKLVIKPDIGKLRPITSKYCSASVSTQKKKRRYSRESSETYDWGIKKNNY